MNVRLLTTTAMVLGCYSQEGWGSAALTGVGGAAVGGAGTHSVEIVTPDNGGRIASGRGALSTVVAATMDESFSAVLSSVAVLSRIELPYRNKPWTKPIWKRPSLRVPTDVVFHFGLVELSMKGAVTDTVLHMLSEYADTVTFSSPIDTAELTPEELFNLGSYLEARDPEAAKTNPARSTMIVDWTLQAYLAGYDKALPRLHRYADEGGWNNSIAQNVLGLIYALGVRVKPDSKKASDYFLKASNGTEFEWGKAQGIINLFMIHDPRIMPRDLLYKVNTLATSGDREAMYQLFKVLPSTNPRKKAFITEAANLKHPIAGYRLSRENFILPDKREVAFRYLEAASTQGHADATWVLSMCYREGRGKVKSDEEGRRLELLSAAQRELFDAQKEPFRQANEFPAFPVDGVPLTPWVASSLREKSRDRVQEEWQSIKEFLKTYGIKRAIDPKSMKGVELRGNESLKGNLPKLKELMTEVSKLTELSELTLDLSGMKITSDGAAVIATVLKSLTGLTHLKLCLSHNEIGETGGLAIGEALGEMSGLTGLLLDIKSNNITDVGALEIITGLSALTGITDLSVSLESNLITAAMQERIENELKTLEKRISKIDLSLGSQNAHTTASDNISGTLVAGAVEATPTTISSTSGSTLIPAAAPATASASLAAVGGAGTHSAAIAGPGAQSASGVGSIAPASAAESDSVIEINLSELATKGKVTDIGLLQLSEYSGNVILSTTTQAIIKLELELNIDESLQGNHPKLTAIMTEISKQTQLCELILDLRTLDITDEGAEVIAASLKSLTGLKTLKLYLTQNNIKDSGAIAIATELKSLTGLKRLVLDLSSNQIGETGGLAIGEALPHLRELKTFSLGLDRNKIRDSGAIAIATGLQSLTGLKSLILNLSSNEIGETGGVSIGETLPHLRGLKEFWIGLRKNTIRNSGATAIATGLKSLTELTSLLGLYLPENEIGETGGLAIGEALPHLQGLNILHLNLSENNIRDRGIIAIATGITSLIELREKTFEYYGNGLTTEGHEEVKHMNQVILEIVRKNKFKGKNEKCSIM